MDTLYKALALLTIVIFFGDCQSDTIPDSNCDHYPNQVLEAKIEELFKEAKWQVYKFNLVKGDSFVVNNPFYADSLYTEKSLCEFDLDFVQIDQLKDTMSFYFSFAKGVSPANGPYYVSASFWPSSEELFGLNLYSRFGFIHQKKDFSEDFTKYLHENKDKLSQSLRCLANERGVFSK